MPRHHIGPTARLAEAKARYDATRIAALAAEAGIKPPRRSKGEAIDDYAERVAALLEKHAQAARDAGEAILALVLVSARDGDAAAPELPNGSSTAAD